MKYLIALSFIKIGIKMLDEGTRAEVLRLLGIAGRKGLI